MADITDINGVALSGITDINGVAKANISDINGVDIPSGSLYQSTIYTFDGETAVTDGTSEWSPSTSLANDGWVNGNSSVNGSKFRVGSVSSKGWNLTSGATASGGTGPNGAMTAYNNPAVDSSSSKKYLYREASNNRYIYDFVARTPGYNFSQLMRDTSNNLRLKFGYHAYGSSISDGIYQVYIDTATTTNTNNGTVLQTLYASGNKMSSGSDDFVIVSVDLNSYRTVDATHYLWLNGTPTYGGSRQYQGDTAIDSVYIEEY